MGPVRQNPIQRTASLFICVRITLCTIAAHNIAQNRPDSFPPYPPDNRADHYIFMMWFVLLLSSFFSSPNLSRRRLDVCHTSTHGVALVQI